jgi:hypothetical protein
MNTVTTMTSAAIGIEDEATIFPASSKVSFDVWFAAAWIGVENNMRNIEASVAIEAKRQLCINLLNIYVHLIFLVT